YEVEKILNDAVIHGVHMYLIKWKGYPHESNTWTAESQLSCPEILKEYLATRKESRVDLSRFYTLLKDAPGMPITVVNDVDDVSYPEGFTYINDNIYSDEVPRPCSPMFPCKCTDECRGACPCVRAQHYDDNGRVQTPVDIPLMECGPKCQCGNKCTTKVVQRGSNVLFEIFRAELKGWGVRAKGVILKGTFITEYVGEVISFEEAERRGMEDTAVGLTYLFDLDKAFEDHEIADFSIDAK
ncbi:SET domain-containing protein, partial [Martensiomyces pterosporus]